MFQAKGTVIDTRYFYFVTEDVAIAILINVTIDLLNISNKESQPFCSSTLQFD